MKRLVIFLVTLMSWTNLASISALAITINFDENDYKKISDYPEWAPPMDRTTNRILGEYGGKIFMISYYDEHIIIFDTFTGEWEDGSTTGIDRQLGTGAVYNGKIYLAGGRPYAQNPRLKNLNVYDMQTDTWEAKAPMLQGVFGAASAVIDGKMYVFSGSHQVDSGNILCSNALQIYDIKTDTWTYGANLPEALWGLNAVTYNGYIYLFGGMNTASQVSLDVYVYDPRTNTYQVLTQMPAASGLADTIINNGIVYLSYPCLSNTTDNIDQIMSYDIEENSWHFFDRKPSTIRPIQSIIVNDKLYIVANTGIYTLDEPNIMRVVIGKGESVQLSTSLQLADNARFDWSSENVSIADIDSMGVATGMDLGIVKITAENDQIPFQEDIYVEVVDNPDLYRLAVDIKIGENRQIRFSRNYYPDEIWSSFDNSIVTVDNKGVIQGIFEGLAIVQAEVDDEIGLIYVRVRK